ncbi:Fc.00g054170.m01.CDS01 [Cosmosporella sp. VM-42]
MDLRSVLNTSDNGDRAPVKAPPPPQQQPQHQRQPSQQPHPPQSPAQYGYRPEYGRPQPQPHPSPGKPIAHDYPHPHHQQPPSNAYPPPSPYQTPGPYPGRPAPPQLQQTNSFHDVRSPSGPVPAGSPYRPVTTPSAVAAASGYPFPPSQPTEMTSPVQRHQYPPAQYQPHQRRESFTQGVAGHPSGPYMQQHPVPQTPPVASAGASQPYLHQRSQSTHSTPTPTSAQSQHPYGPPYVQGSPVAAARPPPGEYNRQPSQPPTPVGPPLSAVASRQSSTTGPYAQPASPYQQRISSIVSIPVVQAQAQAQASPQLPPPPTKRISSSYESSAPDNHVRSQSHSEREQSLSVSPKTRVSSLQSNYSMPLAPSQIETKAAPASAPAIQNMVVDSDRAVTPAKRKLEDRDLSPKELEHRETRPPPGEVNGGHIPSNASASRTSSSPAMPRKKRLRRPQPPIWAQSARSLGKQIPSQANFVLQKRAHAHVNGKQDEGFKAELQSRHASPAATRSQQAGQNHIPPAPPVEAGPQDLLGAWETCITGVKPFEELSKQVADFLFVHVINSEDLQEITSRGIQFEIEAKLGTLIDKDTNHRVDRSVDSECILHNNGRIAFRSSMTEAQHKFFNDFLNQMVIQTDPRAPNGGKRVQVHYKHRREIDRFYDLPLELHGRIPGCVRSRLGSRSKSIRVRISHDQKTGEVINKIIKARVADIDIHLPLCPMDCRISVNLEMNWDGTVEELEQHSAPSDRQPDRNKDRLSYTHGHYQIDLTQVTHSAAGPGAAVRSDKEHELEIELASGILIDQGKRALTGRPHRYPELIDGFLDNVRVLARRASELPR